MSQIVIVDDTHPLFLRMVVDCSVIGPPLKDAYEQAVYYINRTVSEPSTIRWHLFQSLEDDYEGFGCATTCDKAVWIEYISYKGRDRTLVPRAFREVKEWAAQRGAASILMTSDRKGFIKYGFQPMQEWMIKDV